MSSLSQAPDTGVASILRLVTIVANLIHLYRTYYDKPHQWIQRLRRGSQSGGSKVGGDENTKDPDWGNPDSALEDGDQVRIGAKVASVDNEFAVFYRGLSWW